MGEALTLLSGEKELAASNTAEPITPTSRMTIGLSVKAKSSNAASVQIGPATVEAKGYPLAPGEVINFDLIDPTRVFIYGKAKDAVNYLGLVP
jgi:hypothetical protein